MQQKGALLAALFVPIILTALGVGVFLSSQKPSTSQKVLADATCTAPPAVTNVKMNYPSCNGTDCSITSANCTWTAVTGATSYTATITNVDTSSVISTQTITSPTVQVVFPVTANKTYRCDIAAVNSCGQTGTAGTDQLLCETPVVTTPTPTTTPIPAQLGCGYGPCATGNTCITGLTCVQATNGQSYCAYPVYQAACQQSPSVTTCCSAPVVTAAPVQPPVVQPRQPVTGNSAPMLWGALGAGAAIVGSLLFLLF